MPIGTNGSAMLLLSGGIDSPVAGYMIAKRGVEIEATYFHAPPYTSERAKEKVVDLAQPGICLCRADQVACCQFYGYPACIFMKNARMMS